jgi:hypothetical protein
MALTSPPLPLPLPLPPPPPPPPPPLPSALLSTTPRRVGDEPARDPGLGDVARARARSSRSRSSRSTSSA